MSRLVFELNPFAALARDASAEIARGLATAAVSAATPAALLAHPLAEHLDAPAFERWHAGLWEVDQQLKGDLAGLQAQAREYLGCS